MINTSAAYQKAIVADARRILLRAVIDIIDPDISYGAVTGDSAAPWSKPEQLHNKEFKASGEKYITLERGRWILGDAFKVIPDDNVLEGEIGAVNDALCDENCIFDPPAWVQQSFSNVSILQACSLFFSDKDIDGYPVDFTVEVLQGGTAYHTQTFTNNTARSVSLSGFTVYNPDAIKVTATKWSLPLRRMRTIEILPGIYEEWDGDTIATFEVKHQGDISCLALPYGTCVLRMDNQDRRFEPRNKDGVFKSIDERQGIDISLAVRLEDGTDEYKRMGIFYQYSGGWKTGDNGLTMQWNLVDIVGLLAGREFIPPATLPTTLDGWIAALVAQLGDNFASNYSVDPNYANIAVSVREAADVVGMKCGDVLRYVCMATGTWPRADAETGYLVAEPLWYQGNKLTLDNLNYYPTMKANDDIAAIVFTLNDGSDTQYVVSGNSTASSDTKSVKNPFIKTATQALTAARMILSAYGGNRIETIGRGDMSSEIGDVDTIWLNESTATTARRMQQEFAISEGVLRDCLSIFLQADGSFLFENREIITASGTWNAPSGVTQLRVIVVGGGQGGVSGTDGSWSVAGVDGTDGAGGLVWAGTININDGQAFAVTIGEGGSEGAMGGATVFGAYSSADGVLYPLGYTDIANGDSYARTAVALPAANSGDGGLKGKGGRKGNRRTEKVRDYTVNGTLPPDQKLVYIEKEVTIIDNEPGKGTKAAPGASGCVVVYWDKEAT